MSQDYKILLISPTYNEKENINEFLNKVISLNLSVLIIDDNSPDKTAESVKDFQKIHPNVHLISRDKKLGLGSAYREGFKWFLNSQYTHCIEIDSDFSHRFKDLIKIIEKINEFDVVIGSRYISGGGSKGWDRKRKLLSKNANKLSKLILKSQINDMTSGFRSFSKNSLNVIDFKSTRSNGYGFQIEMAFLAELNNLKIIEVPIIFEERRLGKSKMNIWISIEALILLIKLRIRRKKN